MKKYVTTVASVLKILLIPLFAAELFFFILRTINQEAPRWTDMPFLTHLCAVVSAIYAVSVLLLSYSHDHTKSKSGENEADQNTVQHTVSHTVPILVTYLVCCALGSLCARLGARFPAGDTSIPAMIIKSINIARSAVGTVCAFLYIPFALSELCAPGVSPQILSDSQPVGTETLTNENTTPETETDNKTDDTSPKSQER